MGKVDNSSNRRIFSHSGPIIALFAKQGIGMAIVQHKQPTEGILNAAFFINLTAGANRPSRPWSSAKALAGLTVKIRQFPNAPPATKTRLRSGPRPATPTCWSVA